MAAPQIRFDSDTEQDIPIGDPRIDQELGHALEGTSHAGAAQQTPKPTVTQKEAEGLDKTYTLEDTIHKVRKPQYSSFPKKRARQSASSPANGSGKQGRVIPFKQPAIQDAQGAEQALDDFGGAPAEPPPESAEDIAPDIADQNLPQPSSTSPNHPVQKPESHSQPSQDAPESAPQKNNATTRPTGKQKSSHTPPPTDHAQNRAQTSPQTRGADTSATAASPDGAAPAHDATEQPPVAGAGPAADVPPPGSESDEGDDLPGQDGAKDGETPQSIDQRADEILQETNQEPDASGNKEEKQNDQEESGEQTNKDITPHKENPQENGEQNDRSVQPTDAAENAESEGLAGQGQNAAGKHSIKQRGSATQGINLIRNRRTIRKLKKRMDKLNRNLKKTLGDYKRNEQRLRPYDWLHKRIAFQILALQIARIIVLLLVILSVATIVFLLFPSPFVTQAALLALVGKVSILITDLRFEQGVIRRVMKPMKNKRKKLKKQMKHIRFEMRATAQAAQRLRHQGLLQRRPGAGQRPQPAAAQ
jgi:hypothetical protein